MSPARIVVFIVVFLVVASLAGIFFVRSGQKSASPTPAPVSRDIDYSKQDLTPNKAIPSPISLKTVKGSVVSITGNNLVVKTASGNETLNVAETKDFQKVVSDASGNKVAQSSKADIKAGQEVTIAVDQNSGKVLTLVITK